MASCTMQRNLDASNGRTFAELPPTRHADSTLVRRYAQELNEAILEKVIPSAYAALALRLRNVIREVLLNRHGKLQISTGSLS